MGFVADNCVGMTIAQIAPVDSQCFKKGRSNFYVMDDSFSAVGFVALGPNRWCWW